MKAEITPTEEPEKLAGNLKKRAKSVKIEGKKIIAEVDEEKILERTPGIESFMIEGEKTEGLGGSPTDELIYTSLESRKDAVKAFLATLQGYSIVILNSERTWDMKQLKKYNPDIKHIKSKKPPEELDIEKSLDGAGNTKKIELEMPEEDNIERIYREMLT